MSSLELLTIRLSDRHNLSSAQVSEAVVALASADVSDDSKANFLTALAQKGETAEEVAAFAKQFRAKTVDPGVGAWASRAIDVVGTGGDHSGGFNVSSLVVLVLACAGVPVMKHGNRGVTSRCGSADLMAAFGVDLEASPERLRTALDQLGFVFFFAPAYHPTFRNINPVRKALAARGQRTIFNVLGPLLNPGRPAQILAGVYGQPWVQRLALALDTLGTAAGLVVHGELATDRGIDELTTATVNHVRGVGRLRGLEACWRAKDFGLPAADFSDLHGSDLAGNLALVEAILSGRAPAGLVDTIVLNAAVGLWICGRIPNIADGIGPSREHLLGGAVGRKLQATKEFYQTR